MSNVGHRPPKDKAGLVTGDNTNIGAALESMKRGKFSEKQLVDFFSEHQNRIWTSLNKIEGLGKRAADEDINIVNREVVLLFTAAETVREHGYLKSKEALKATYDIENQVNARVTEVATKLKRGDPVQVSIKALSAENFNKFIETGDAEVLKSLHAEHKSHHLKEGKVAEYVTDDESFINYFIKMRAPLISARAKNDEESQPLAGTERREVPAKVLPITESWQTYNDQIVLADKMKSIEDNNRVSFWNAFGYTIKGGMEPSYATITASGALLMRAGVATGTTLLTAAGTGLAIGGVAGLAATEVISSVQATGHLRRKDKMMEQEIKKGKISGEIDSALQKSGDFIRILVEGDAYEVPQKEKYRLLLASIDEFMQHKKVPENLREVLQHEADEYMKIVANKDSSIKKAIGQMNDKAFDYHIHAKIANKALLYGATKNELRDLKVFEKQAKKAEKRLKNTKGWRSHVLRGPEGAEEKARQLANELGSKVDSIAIQVYTLMAEKVSLDLPKGFANEVVNSKTPTEARNNMVKTTETWLKEVT